MHHMPAVESCV